MTLYMVWFDADGVDDTGLAEMADGFRLQPGLFLVDSEDSRSRVYHDIKHWLGGDRALAVAPLARAPKFKGMAEGALNWVRARED